MKKVSLNRKLVTTMNRIIGHCFECDNDITENEQIAYVDADGNMYCCIECLLEHFEIKTIEF